MRLTVLNVAYPLSPVSQDAIGGGEQIVCHLDRAIVRAGHRSIVIACEGSQVDGDLVTVASVHGALDDSAIEAARRRHAEAISRVLASEPVDVVHMHGPDFHAYLPPPGVPVLVTLHCPVSWYASEGLQTTRPQTWFNCVSRSQQSDFRPQAALLSPIENGVPIDEPPRIVRKRRFALMLCRISRDKGVHLGIKAAKLAGIPLLIAGKVFAFADHLQYFEEEVRPALDDERCFIGPADLAAKRRLLATARCLLVPSLAAETSSLVAREALAAGTPVIGFPQGALTEVIEHGRTGFLVRSADEMAAAIKQSVAIDPESCRRAAREHFSLTAMTRRYLSVYETIVGNSRRQLRLGAA